ncbi:KinB-signaling pathway activation protein [Bacillus sp. FJAT-42376]|uniref:KinB-signaling pathway activation protein n=1 Tax=Bacillus sp. FJAT-42376 TaxID=2014076 RepID=UPI000F4D421F|nr:KinB-signaling pathway activation protein [Bacillus sp. FJAT-42376]AZB41294.1 KinB-signaling pathway activation protein [Bacillus sp. FJAT-42376]
MKSRDWVKFFFSSLLVGAAAAIASGFILNWDQQAGAFAEFQVDEIFASLIWFIGVGLMFSVISQMGFFAYLTLHRFGMGIFGSVWNAVQLLLIAFVLFDLVYFRYQIFGDSGSVLPYIWPAAGFFAASLITAYLKQRDTNKGAFIPALFFMFVGTAIEWFPALRENDPNWLYFMLISLLCCNAYQLIMLPRFSRSSRRKIGQQKTAQG